MILTVTPNASLDRMIAVRHLNLGSPTRPDRVLLHPGGGGVHASRVIRQLGGETLATGFLGGENGRIVKALMDAEGLPHDFVVIANQTRCNVCVVEDERGNLVELPEQGPEVSVEEVEALVAKVKTLLPRASLLLLSGSLPPGTPADFFQSLVRLSHVPVILDTSGPALKAGLAARPWLVKPNLVEFEVLVGKTDMTEAEQIREAERLVGEGVGAVALTRGADPILLVTGEGTWRITPPRIRCYNSIGCGDTFTGAVAVHYLRTRDLVAAVAYGVAAATVNCFYLAAGWAPPEEVAKMLPRVKVERIPRY